MLKKKKNVLCIFDIILARMRSQDFKVLHTESM